MKARVKWTEGNHFIGETDNSHIVIMEASASKTSAGPSPMEMLLMGMGACASSDVVSILLKMRQNVDDVTVEMEPAELTASPASSQTFMSLSQSPLGAYRYLKLKKPYGYRVKYIAQLLEYLKSPPKLRSKQKSLKPLKPLIQCPQQLLLATQKIHLIQNRKIHLNN